MRALRDERFKQVAVAAVILTGVLAMTFAIRLGSTLPGVAGEFFGVVTGVLSTPVLLEVSFFFVGLIIVFAVNHWQAKRDGDEFVYLDQIQEPEALHLPDQAKWAIYKNPPLPGLEPSLLVQAEGAFEIGDFEAATTAIGEMDDAELHLPETNALRIKLARATGHDDLARKLGSPDQA